MMKQFDLFSLDLSRCFMSYFLENGRYYPVHCDVNFCPAYICEFDANTATSTKGITLNDHFDQLQDNGEVCLVLCPSGHFMHEFLHCDVKGQCGYQVSENRCMQGNRATNVNATQYTDGLQVDMFQCGETRETIPYTLVCDFRHHCLGGDDETFCVHQNYQTGFRLVLDIITNHHMTSIVSNQRT